MQDEAASAKLAKITITTVDGPVEIQFTGDVRTSSFISGYIEDMDIALDNVDITDLPNKHNMTRADAERFFAMWAILSSPSSADLNENLGKPEYFQGHSYEPAACMPAELAALFRPTAADIVEHTKYLTSKFPPMTEEQLRALPAMSKLLDKKLPFMTYVKFINFADFLGIDCMKNLMAAMFAGYMILYAGIAHVQAKS